MTSFACSPGNASHATAAGTLLLALGLLTLSFLRNEGKEYTRDGLAQNATRALVRRDLWISGGMISSIQILTSLALFGGFTTADVTVPKPDVSKIVNYVSWQAPLSQAGMLANIGPNGTLSQGALPGVVIASPSTENPNYLFTWVRDGSLVFKLMIDQYIRGNNTGLKTHIDDWISSQGRLQHIPNPSGATLEGDLLGEPKFNINETAFTGPWGQPQRDGPALRTIAIITYGDYLAKHGDYLAKHGDKTTIPSKFWPMVKLDLDYVSQHWNEITFDLWEETDGHSFFTTAMQHRALRQGAVWARAMKDSAREKTYSAQADNVLCFLQSYWDDSKGYIIANMNVNNNKSQRDTQTFLAAIHAFDPEAGCDAATFQPCSDKALANHYAVVNSFRDGLYPINGDDSTGAVAVGRYREDVYYEGNPWFLSTFAAAEQLYDALYTWNKIGSLRITNISLNFFKQFLPSAKTGSHKKTSQDYETITNGVKKMADDFVLINAKYTPNNGSLFEQYNKTTGEVTSAIALTWSFASSLTAFDRRAGLVPATWNAKGLKPHNAPCAIPSLPAKTANVTFNVYAPTQFNENIFMVGNIPQLANYNVNNAIALSYANAPTWSMTTFLPGSLSFYYSFVRELNGTRTLENVNHTYTTPSGGLVTLNNSWTV